LPRPRDDGRRRALLDALIDAFASGGIGRRSLRELADAVGTSHRMLLHHFGSREELIVAVVQEMERRQAAFLVELPDDPADAFAAMWADLRRPELRPFERLFFECYSRAAQGEAPFTRLLPAAVQGWLDDVDRLTEGKADPALARLGLAATRGLLLDLVATDDEEGVDAAAACLVTLLRHLGDTGQPEDAELNVSMEVAGADSRSGPNIVPDLG
jgi:AcrR family transcriptional regulator